MSIVFSILDFDTATAVFGGRDAAIRIQPTILPSTVVLDDSGTPRVTTRPSVALPEIVVNPNDAAGLLIDNSRYPDGFGAVRANFTSDPVTFLGVRSIIPGTQEDFVDRHALNARDIGLQYRLPFLPDGTNTQPIRVTITAIDAARVVLIRSLQNSFPDTRVPVPADHTLLWRKGLTGSGTILVSADGPVAVSAVLRRSDPSRIRVYPTAG